jgi:hypothetical protein
MVREEKSYSVGIKFAPIVGLQSYEGEDKLRSSVC